MNQINTNPIELYLEKERIASRSGQKTLTLDIREARALSDSLAALMARLLNGTNTNVQTEAPEIRINMDGGRF